MKKFIRVKLTIDFYSLDELHALFDRLQKIKNSELSKDEALEESSPDPSLQEETKPVEDDLYSIKNFTI